MKTTLISLAAALLFTGCALGPTAKAPDVAMPTAWSLAAGDAAPDWAGLLDPTLAALQDRALAANLDLAIAAQRWKQAQLLAEQSALRWTPSASLSTSASRPVETQNSTRNVDVGGGITVPVTTSTGWNRSYGASLGVGYELDLWDRLAQTTAGQRASAEAARTDIEAARLSIRSQVAEAYWTLAALRAQQPLAETQLALTRETLALTRLRVREGKLLPIEVDKAASSLQGLHSRLAQLQRERVQQGLSLGVLLDELAPALPAQPQLPAGQPGDWQPGAPAEVLERRPDVQRARAQVDSALSQWRSSEAARYPSLSLSLGLGTGGSQWRDWLERPLATLSSSLIVPLVDWRRLDLQRAQSVNEVESAALSLRDTVHKALVEVEQLAAERRELRQQALANAARLAEAQQTEKLAALRYEVGVIARADWLQARNARLSAEQEAIQLRLRQWLNQAALQKALASA